jgi:hypothetical protein
VSSPKRVIVEEIKLCYYATPPGTEQPYLKPTYYFTELWKGRTRPGLSISTSRRFPSLGGVVLIPSPLFVRR